MERAFEVVPADEIYSVTGIQFLPFNTLYQVLADKHVESHRGAATRLPIADYFNFRFSGRQTIEVSMASTTQMMDVNTRLWSTSLMGKFGLDVTQWVDIVPSGTRRRPKGLDSEGNAKVGDLEDVVHE